MLNKVEDILERVIFFSRWIQLPMYLGLIVASLLYSYKFLVELSHLIHGIQLMSESAVMMLILTLVDFTMVANLVFMVIVGGYSTFISKMSFVDKHEDRPEWLQKVDAGTLKVKLAASLVGVSGIHLLQTFINISNKTSQDVMLQMGIHCVFLISTIMLAYSEKLLHSKH